MPKVTFADAIQLISLVDQVRSNEKVAQYIQRAVRCKEITEDGKYWKYGFLDIGELLRRDDFDFADIDYEEIMQALYELAPGDDRNNLVIDHMLFGVLAREGIRLLVTTYPDSVTWEDTDEMCLLFEVGGVKIIL